MILTVFSQTSFATVQVTGTSNVNINEISAPLTVNLTPNATEYKGATFAWYPGNGTLQGNTYNFSGLLRIHVNWDVANTNYFLNILRIYDTGNLTGSFNLTLIHTAKQANEELGSQINSKWCRNFIYVDIRDTSNLNCCKRSLRKYSKNHEDS